MRGKSVYEVLGIPDFSSIELIKQAYDNASEDVKRKLGLSMNFDKVYNYLSNKKNKDEYDGYLKKFSIQEEKNNQNSSQEIIQKSNISYQRERIHLICKIAERKNKLLCDAYLSQEYSLLISKEIKVDNEIADFYRKRRKIKREISAINDSLKILNEFSSFPDTLYVFVEHTKECTKTINELEKCCEKLECDIKSKEEELKELGQKISNYPNEFSSNDQELQRLNKLLFELEQKILLQKEGKVR